MRIITTTGYCLTGSSAVTDYLSEFDCCKYLTDYEFRFVQDLDGISDLEFELVENHNRHNSGYALKRYKRYVDFLAGNRLVPKYERFFHGQWKKISYEYIDALTDFTFKGYDAWDVIDRGMLFYTVCRTINKFYEKVLFPGKHHRFYELPHEIIYCSRPSEEHFLQLTREYIDKLFLTVNPENYPDVMVDQIVAPSNISRYLRYFNDVMVFLVERDPRDLYLLARYEWNSPRIPAELELFCKWYEYTRAHRKTEDFDPQRVYFLYFEDMVYKYDETTAKIQNFLGYDKAQHIRPKSRFIPEDSMTRTRLWEKKLGQGHESEVAFIEQQLSEYLYEV